MSDEPEHSVAAARQAAGDDDLSRWVATFLRSPGSDNAGLGDALAERELAWHGPVELRFDQLHRLAGPPDEPVLAPLTDDDLERVEGISESIEDGWEPPPLIVTYQGGHLVLEDGNHRIEGLRQTGRHGWWAVVGFDDPRARDDFAAATTAARAATTAARAAEGGGGAPEAASTG